ncbi:MAG: 16S rRNA (guanine(527)-N(7))-methyltransferase RsmG [Calditerrivibrio sp.]|nr:16S rRNA (guanine(527)-N(7))-methyltransferase RsmG [Calditerrivibrio sp.]
MIDKYFNITSDQVLLLEEFYKLHLLSPHNLTAIKDRHQFYIKHYLDSIYCFKDLHHEFSTLCDIGSGGGFPGIVIAILMPSKNVFLCESIKKKCQFLEHAIRYLSLKNVQVINDRIENIKGVNFDVLTARGVSKVLDVLKKSWNVSHETSLWILYKGEHLFDELKEAEQFVKKRGLEVCYERVEFPFFRTYCFVRRKK